MSETNQVTEGEAVAYVCATKIYQLVIHVVMKATKEAVDKSGMDDATKREFLGGLTAMFGQLEKNMDDGAKLVDALMSEVKFYREMESI